MASNRIESFRQPRGVRSSIPSPTLTAPLQCPLLWSVGASCNWSNHNDCRSKTKTCQKKHKNKNKGKEKETGHKQKLLFELLSSCPSVRCCCCCCWLLFWSSSLFFFVFFIFVFYPFLPVVLPLAPLFVLDFSTPFWTAINVCVELAQAQLFFVIF